jgi:hypothetical protein
MKRLVIISGITGAIGSALLAIYGTKKNSVIYGISRQAVAYENFINKKTGKLFCSTFVCSLTGAEESCGEFVSLIDFNQFSEVIYIHALGVYPFEINEKGAHVIENDDDRDGIDDRCTLLSYDIFRWITSEIISRTKSTVKFITFGGLADKHQPEIISSWWQTMEKVEHYMKEVADGRIGMYKFNISSVLCPHELITRPFVFVNTEADYQSWLLPSQLAKRVLKELLEIGGYHEFDVYNPWKGFFPNYYANENMVLRRLRELYLKQNI